MDWFLRPNVLLIAVVLSAVFPFSVWQLHSRTSELTPPTDLAAQQIPYAFKAAEQQFSPVIQQEISQKRFQAIQAAKKSGQQEYSFRIKVPPPPVSGQ